MLKPRIMGDTEGGTRVGRDPTTVRARLDTTRKSRARIDQWLGLVLKDPLAGLCTAGHSCTVLLVRMPSATKKLTVVRTAPSRSAVNLLEEGGITGLPIYVRRRADRCEMSYAALAPMLERPGSRFVSGRFDVATLLYRVVFESSVCSGSNLICSIYSALRRHRVHFRTDCGEKEPGVAPTLRGAKARWQLPAAPQEGSEPIFEGRCIIGRWPIRTPKDDGVPTTARGAFFPACYCASRELFCQERSAAALG
jgi:hypothetical protein